MIAILGFIGILVLGFVILGLIGWGVQALGLFASFLGKVSLDVSDVSVNSFGFSFYNTALN